MKRFLFYLGVSSVILCAALVCTLAFVFEYPGVIVNDQNIARVLRRFNEKTWPVEWAKIHVDLKSLSFWKKSVSLQLQDFCFHPEKGSIDACFKKIEIAFELDLQKKHIDLTDIENIEVDEGQIRLKKTDGQMKVMLPVSLASFFDSAVFHKFQLRHILWEKSDGSARGQINLRTLEVREKPEIEFSGETQAHVGQIELKGHIQPSTAGLEKGFHLNEFQYALDFHFEKEGKDFSGGLKGERVKHQIVSYLDFKSKNLFKGNKSIDLSNCKITAQRKFPEDSSDITFSCPGDIVFAYEGFRHNLLDLKTEVRADITGEISAPSFPPLPFEFFEASVNAQFKPFLSQSLEADTIVKLHIKGLPVEPPVTWAIDSRVHYRLAAAHFQKIVKQLRGTEDEIFAPFHVFEGPVSLEGEGELSPDGGLIPAHFKTDLRSREQSIRAHGTGSVRVDFHHRPFFNFNFGLVFDELRLQLPTLSLESPPRLYPAKKIHSKINQQKTKNDLMTYRVRMRTTNDHPAEFLTNVAAKPFPVAFDITKSSDSPYEGQVQVKDYVVTLFKKDVQINHFALALRFPYRESEMNGQFTAKFPEIFVDMRLLGTIAKPILRLYSDPPLTNHEILAVLLYGKSLDELDAEESSSVASTSQALTDSAMGLASLYMFASTPLESVTYDSDTQTVNAKFRLAGDTSLNVSAEEGEFSSIGLRHRLSRHWAVSTEVDRYNESTTGLAAVLEWMNRY